MRHHSENLLRHGRHQHYMGRHHHGHGRHGFGRFGGGFMEDDGTGGRGMRMGRKLASGDLQLLVLALLAEKPRHGYEIIKALEEKSKGFYTPSPGMVYPALTYLEEIGYATVAVDGTRKLYRVTATGEAQLASNRAIVDSMFAQFDRVGEKMERFRRAFSNDETADADAEDAGSEPRGSSEMLRARRELKIALNAAAETREESKRIADILRRAAAEIRADTPAGK
ncbi:MAG TPA: PadR family transcriptional regulator [Steroidobacteraceae bacterium]